jgi:hypothetical protein
MRLIISTYRALWWKFLLTRDNPAIKKLTTLDFLEQTARDPHFPGFLLDAPSRCYFSKDFPVLFGTEVSIILENSAGDNFMPFSGRCVSEV